MELKRQLAAVVVLSLLGGCNNLSDADYQALRCGIWREQDSDRRSAPYSVVLNKNYQCWKGSIRASGVNYVCTAENEQKWLEELNQAYDLLLN